MTSFTAIDFETAQGPRWSICQVGIVRVEGGRVVDTVNKLVQPPDNYYSYYNTELHGICSTDTMDEPCFDVVWPEISQYIQGQCVVAHNGSFDFGCLKTTLEYYQMDVPSYQQECTFKIYRNNLASIWLRFVRSTRFPSIIMTLCPTLLLVRSSI